jgi:membrane fusion protein (multidrug efflux system)
MFKGAFLVPQRAVSELQATYSIGVVNSDNKVEMRSVKMGPRVGGLWVVESGLRPGESIVVEGLLKVRNGSVVVPTAVTLDDNGTEVKPAPESGKGSGEKPAPPAGEGK